VYENHITHNANYFSKFACLLVYLLTVKGRGTNRRLDGEGKCGEWAKEMFKPPAILAA